ncbi:MAG: helix-hairpin-helix domain-containing protein, partial [Nitriliruptoraceae bacterium]
RQREFGRATKHARCHVPQRGDKRRLLATVTTNAQDSFERSRLKRANDFDSRSRALTELQQALGLDEPLLRIECYDISHLAGTEVVGSMVVFEDGLPKKSDYRRFKLTVDANDDVAAMREVIERRFTRLVKDRAAPLDVQRKSFAYPPSLVIIDGGVGQLRAARAAIENLPIDDIPFVGLAKRFEQLWIEGKSKPVELPRGSDALYLVQRVRDEAHRFAVTHQRQRRNRAITTALDEVPGIGPRRRAALLRTFGSITNLKRASTEEISAVDGISPTLAAVLHQHLHDDTRGT